MPKQFDGCNCRKRNLQHASRTEWICNKLEAGNKTWTKGILKLCFSSIYDKVKGKSVFFFFLFYLIQFSVSTKLIIWNIIPAHCLRWWLSHPNTYNRLVDVMQSDRHHVVLHSFYFFPSYRLLVGRRYNTIKSNSLPRLHTMNGRKGKEKK